MITECKSCGAVLSEEELDGPYTNTDGDTLCDECHQEDEFECCWCHESSISENQHKMLVIIKTIQSIKPGVYKIISWPYYADGMIDFHLFTSSLARFAKLPKDIKFDDYRAGHLCDECQEKIIVLAKADLAENRERT